MSETNTAEAVTVEVQPRLKNPARLLPGAQKAIQDLTASCQQAGVPAAVMEFVHLRTSQINGCSFCVDYAWRGRKKGSEEEDRRLFAVAAWRETPYFTSAERAALALAESVTRLADRPDPVPDEVWDEAARHFDEKQLAAIVLWVSVTNVYNRVNASTRQPAGTWAGPES